VALPKKYADTENNGRLHWERGRPRPQPKVKTYSSLAENAALVLIVTAGARASSISPLKKAQRFAKKNCKV